MCFIREMFCQYVSLNRKPFKDYNWTQGSMKDAAVECALKVSTYSDPSLRSECFSVVVGGSSVV